MAMSYWLRYPLLTISMFSHRDPAGDPPARRHAYGVAACVPEPRAVLVPVRRRARAVELRGQRVVAGDEVQPGPVESRHHGVGPVLAAVAEGDDVRRVVELAVAVGVADAPDPLSVHVGVERVEGPGHPLGAAHVDGEPLDRRHGRGVADGRGLDPEEALAALVTGEQRSVRAVGEGDPRALHLVGHAVEQLGDEALGEGDALRGAGELRLARVRGGHLAAAGVEGLDGDAPAPGEVLRPHRSEDRGVVEAAAARALPRAARQLVTDHMRPSPGRDAGRAPPGTR